MSAVDRSGCTAARHGNESAYRQGCRCDAARADRRTKQKLREAGLHRPAYTGTAGTLRRLQALGALGWSVGDLAARLDTPAITVKQVRMGVWPQVRADFADKVDRLYAELQGTPGPSERARTWAEKLGWAPPLAWDDDTIDDPAAKPVEDKPVKQSSVDLADVEFLRRCGVSRDEIADRMHVKPESIERAEQRAAERARNARTERLVAEARAALDDTPTRWDDHRSPTKGQEHVYA